MDDDDDDDDENETQEVEKRICLDKEQISALGISGIVFCKHRENNARNEYWCDEDESEDSDVDTATSESCKCCATTYTSRLPSDESLYPYTYVYIPCYIWSGCPHNVNPAYNLLRTCQGRCEQLPTKPEGSMPVCQINGYSNQRSQCTQVTASEAFLLESRERALEDNHGNSTSTVLSRLLSSKGVASDSKYSTKCLCQISSPLRDSDGRCILQRKCPCNFFSLLLKDKARTYRFLQNCPCSGAGSLPEENMCLSERVLSDFPSTDPGWKEPKFETPKPLEASLRNGISFFDELAHVKTEPSTSSGVTHSFSSLGETSSRQEKLQEEVNAFLARVTEIMLPRPNAAYTPSSKTETSSETTHKQSIPSEKWPQSVEEHLNLEKQEADESGQSKSTEEMFEGAVSKSSGLEDGRRESNPEDTIPNDNLFGNGKWFKLVPVLGTTPPSEDDKTAKDSSSFITTDVSFIRTSRMISQVTGNEGVEPLAIFHAQPATGRSKLPEENVTFPTDASWPISSSSKRDFRPFPSSSPRPIVGYVRPQLPMPSLQVGTDGSTAKHHVNPGTSDTRDIFSRYALNKADPPIGYKTSFNQSSSSRAEGASKKPKGVRFKFVGGKSTESHQSDAKKMKLFGKKKQPEISVAGRKNN